MRSGGEVALSKQDFVAAGGEAQVFRKGSTAFKLYHDPTRMIPLGKIQELAAIRHPAVVKPDAVIEDPKTRAPLGYTMRFVPDGVTLCQLFTRAYRDRTGIDPARILALVRKLQACMAGVHGAGCLIVDFNEMNLLTDAAHEEVFALDADSWQTPHFHATALMESVRDRQMADPHAFTEGTDWFAFAIVSFQLFIGIHPYKGKHGTVRTLDERMRANLSVLNPAVSRPNVCYPFDVIPPVYRAWYDAVLERGTRCAPPADLVGGVGVSVATAAAPVQSTQKLEITGYVQIADPITVIGWLGSGGVGQTAAFGAPWSVLGLFRGAGVIVVGQLMGGGLLHLRVPTRAQIPFGLLVSQVSSYRGQIYALCGSQIVEVTLHVAGASVLASPSVCAEVLPNATRLYEGCALSNLLGAAWAYLLPAPGLCYPLHVPELDGRRIVDAKFAGHARGAEHAGVLGVVAERGGRYDRFLFRFALGLGTYEVECVPDVAPAGVNLAVLDTGVLVVLDEDERLVLSNALPGSGARKIVEDPALSGDMRLFSHGATLGFVRGDRAYTMRLR